MGMYVCKACMAEHQLKSEKTDSTNAVHLLLGCCPVRACCELCGPLAGDWSQKEVEYTDRITRRCGTNARANALAELAAYR